MHSYELLSHASEPPPAPGAARSCSPTRLCLFPAKINQLGTGNDLVPETCFLETRRKNPLFLQREDALGARIWENPESSQLETRVLVPGTGSLVLKNKPCPPAAAPTGPSGGAGPRSAAVTAQQQGILKSFCPGDLHETPGWPNQPNPCEFRSPDAICFSKSNGMHSVSIENSEARYIRFLARPTSVDYHNFPRIPYCTGGGTRRRRQRRRQS